MGKQLPRKFHERCGLTEKTHYPRKIASGILKTISTLDDRVMKIMVDSFTDASSTSGLGKVAESCNVGASSGWKVGYYGLSSLLMTALMHLTGADIRTYHRLSNSIGKPYKPPMTCLYYFGVCEGFAVGLVAACISAHIHPLVSMWQKYRQ